MIELLEQLNPQQQDIVKDTRGPLLVLAGAGSGKTRVLTYRIAYLLSQGVKPWNILAITFTNKAAREMRERLEQLSGKQALDVWMGTFHGICLRILFRFGKEIGLENITIIDEKEQKKLMKETLETIASSIEIEQALSIISTFKNKLVTPDMALEDAPNNPYGEEIAHVYMAYEEKKTELDYLDFDDIIMKAIHLLEVNEVARDTYQQQFHFVSCDESQDTNDAQYKLIKLLSAQHGNVMYVGDTDQGIYSWRGAEIKNILNLKSYYPDLKEYQLGQNYRSTQVIVDASNALVKRNKQRLEKEAFSQNEYGDKITLYQADDDSREADYIANIIRRGHNVRGIPYKDFAVLYRMNRQSRAVESALTHAGIPYQIINGTNFADRKEVKDLIGYLRAINNPNDTLALERIINTPKRGIGDTTLKRVKDYGDECAITFAKALEVVEDVPKVNAKTAIKIKDFLSLMENMRAAAKEMPIAEIIKEIIVKTEYLKQFDITKEDDLNRVGNIKELINLAGKWDEDDDNEGKGLMDFLAESSLASDVDSLDGEEDAVVLQSVHSSKGLEYENVFLVGLEENMFPMGRAASGDDLEEERRLMYVAMTRAKKRLFISNCRQRYEYGNPRPVFNKPSRFLREIPEMYVKRI